MKKENFTYSFTTPKPAEEVFKLLLNISQWWSGLYEEAIEGKSQQVNDEFTFNAGGGVHYSKQKLTELIPGKRIAWTIVESNLNFLNDPGEWSGTTISFDLQTENGKTKVTFTHEGLVPQIECYDACSSAWTGYMSNLEKKLK